MTPEESAASLGRRISEGRRAAAEARARRVEAIRSATVPADLTLLAYDVATAAALTCTSVRSLRSAIDSGRLEARKMGRKVLIEAAALRAWIAALPTTRTDQA